MQAYFLNDQILAPRDGKSNGRTKLYDETKDRQKWTILEECNLVSLLTPEDVDQLKELEDEVGWISQLMIE